ncbi:uncharacterized protein VTP21DRAFT_3 [Calcarisporiella thermophila]|uniref:uncharacterized protein n=1 Tax=Calcarisporiella thermophila TaxID=911321 RepID=UPI003742AE0E
MLQVCVLISSYEETNSPFEKYDNYQDPSRYVSSDKYKFHLRFIKKETAFAQLQSIYEENFDVYINFLWGQEYEEVAGIEALKFIENKGVPIVGTSSKFLSLSKLDFKFAAKKHGIPVPEYNIVKDKIESFSLNKYPLIVKPSRGCGSQHMTEKSVCHNIEELKAEINKLIDEVECEILVEEFIIGREFSVMVIEGEHGVFAMTPIVYSFPSYMTQLEQFLHFENKFDSIEQKKITYSLASEEDSLVKKLKDIACRSYCALDVHGCGYARVDLRVDEHDNIYVLEVNPTPAFFCQYGNEFGDDYVIDKCFPGKHEGLIDLLINSKLKLSTIRQEYDKMSDRYDGILNTSNIPNIIRKMVLTYDFSGIVLDLGCGTGIFGKIINDYGQDAEMIGVDLSPKMTEKAAGYSVIEIGLMQDVVFSLKHRKIDHVVSTGALHFLNNDVFKSTLMRLFEIADKSITLSIEDIPEEYNQNLIRLGVASMYSYNNTFVAENIIIPKDWERVHREYTYMWKSPATGNNIYGTIFRFERTGSRRNW